MYDNILCSGTKIDIDLLSYFIIYKLYISMTYPLTFRPLHITRETISHTDHNKSYHHIPLASHIHTVTLLSRKLHVLF